MPIARVGKFKIIIARTYRGTCQLCQKPVIKGQAYLPCIGGTNISNGFLAHYNCYKPEKSPKIGADIIDIK